MFLYHTSFTKLKRSPQEEQIHPFFPYYPCYRMLMAIEKLSTTANPNAPLKLVKVLLSITMKRIYSAFTSVLLQVMSEQIKTSFAPFSISKINPTGVKTHLPGYTKYIYTVQCTVPVQHQINSTLSLH